MYEKLYAQHTEEVHILVHILHTVSHFHRTITEATISAPCSALAANRAAKRPCNMHGHAQWGRGLCRKTNGSDEPPPAAVPRLLPMPKFASTTDRVGEESTDT